MIIALILDGYHVVGDVMEAVCAEGRLGILGYLLLTYASISFAASFWRIVGLVMKSYHLSFCGVVTSAVADRAHRPP